MNENILQQLADIYNNLLRVHTCGEDSFIYTDCMKALFSVIKSNMNNNSNLNMEE